MGYRRLQLGWAQARAWMSSLSYTENRRSFEEADEGSLNYVRTFTSMYIYLHRGFCEKVANVEWNNYLNPIRQMLRD